MEKNPLEQEPCRALQRPLQCGAPEFQEEQGTSCLAAKVGGSPREAVTLPSAPDAPSRRQVVPWVWASLRPACREVASAGPTLSLGDSSMGTQGSASRQLWEGLGLVLHPLFSGLLARPCAVSLCRVLPVVPWWRMMCSLGIDEAREIGRRQILHLKMCQSAIAV